MKKALGCLTSDSLHAMMRELLQCKPIFRQISDGSICRVSQVDKFLLFGFTTSLKECLGVEMRIQDLRQTIHRSHSI